METNEKKLLVLKKVIELFNDANINYGIGGTLLMYMNGLIPTFRDLDFIIDIKQIYNVDQILSKIGKKQLFTKNNVYRTQVFIEYTVDGVEIDLMSNIKIRNSDGVYVHSFDDLAKSGDIVFDNSKIKTSTLEDWFIIYSLVDDRTRESEMICNYLCKKQNLQTKLLKRNLDKEIPVALKKRILSMIE